MYIWMTREEREKETEAKLEKIMTENFLQLMMSDTNPQIQETQRTGRINAKKTSPRHIIFNLQKINDKEKSRKKSEESTTDCMGMDI